jgi:hypothetical protein
LTENLSLPPEILEFGLALELLKHAPALPDRQPDLRPVLNALGEDRAGFVEIVARVEQVIGRAPSLVHFSTL